MNAKIFELGRQATLWCCDNLNPDTPREDWDAAWEQKFAELIVRECVGKCEFVADMATITNTGEMARKTKATADSCATMIKQHFGIE